MLNRVRLWMRSVLLRRRLEREMQEEMAAHLEQSAARLRARGLSAEDAQFAARREFGNVTYMQEEGRYARGTARLDALLADLRFALRQYARKPMTTITMFIVLVGGMSISTLLFSFVHSYATSPPPGIELTDDLVRIRGSRDAGIYGRTFRNLSAEEIEEYRKLTDHFALVAGWTDGRLALDAGADLDRKGLDSQVSFVTADYFKVIGVRPMVGAGLPAQAFEDPSLASVVVIGHTMWEQLFAKDPGVIGSTIRLNDVPFTVVGVAPEKFTGVAGFVRFRIWMPLSARSLVLPGPATTFRAAGRLQPGVTHDAATAAAQVVAARTVEPSGAARAFVPEDETRMVEPSTEVLPLLSANGDPMFERDVRIMSFAIGLLGLLVLLVACTNVSALLTGLAAARRHEIAVRLSLGAARMRLIRQLLTESALLAVAAAAAAIGTVWLMFDLFDTYVTWMPFELRVTWPSTIFTFGVALAAGVLFGLSPALHATRLAVATALRDSTASLAAKRARLQRGLVVAQIAFTQPLIVMLAAVLLIIFTEYRPASWVGFADRLIELRIPQTEFTSQDAESALRQRIGTLRLLERIESTPGVARAVIDWGYGPELGAYEVHPEDRTGQENNAVKLESESAAEGYFDVMGIRVLRGREFRPEDARTGQATTDAAAIIGADLAGRLWAGADPIGRRLRFVGDSVTAPRTLTVVGVIDDPAAETRDPRSGFRVYLPADTSRAIPGILARTAGVAQPLVPTLRAAVQQDLPGTISLVRTVAEIQDGHKRRARMVMGGVSAAGLAALLLSALGLYAVVAFSVAQRTGEIAVRIAVGARGEQISRKFIADGLRLSGFGLLFGLPASLLGLSVLLGMPDMPQVPLPHVTAIAALGIGIVATIAAWVPARRAAAVDPAVTLRRE